MKKTKFKKYLSNRIKEIGSGSAIRGITLISLIITIILLLILAGITISQLTGSGLFENAKLAKEKYENAQEKEDDILKQYENVLENKEIVSDRDTVTIPAAEYQNLKDATSYSFDEKVIGKYADGSLLYKKTFAGTIGNSNTLSDVTGLKIKDVVAVYGSIHDSSNEFLPIGFYNGTGYYASAMINDNSLQIRINEDYRGYTYIITVEYTKTEN